MPVKVRLMRIGSKKHPFYRVVAVDERKKRTGAYIEALGTYNPLTKPKEIILKQDRIDDWIKKGAVLSTGYLRIIGKAPQRLPRKAKKASKQDSGVSAKPTPAEQVVETPVEESNPEESQTLDASLPETETKTETAEAQETNPDVIEVTDNQSKTDPIEKSESQSEAEASSNSPEPEKLVKST